MKKISKKIGLGTFSLLLTIMGILFSFSVGGKPCYGDSILKFIGLKPYGRGIHYTIYYSLIFFIPAAILAYKHKNDFGAKIGGLIALWLSAPILTLIIMTLFNLY